VSKEDREKALKDRKAEKERVEVEWKVLLAGHSQLVMQWQAHCATLAAVGVPRSNYPKKPKKPVKPKLKKLGDEEDLEGGGEGESERRQ